MRTEKPTATHNVNNQLGSLRTWHTTGKYPKSARPLLTIDLQALAIVIEPRGRPTHIRDRAQQTKQVSTDVRNVSRPCALRARCDPRLPRGRRIPMLHPTRPPTQKGGGRNNNPIPKQVLLTPRRAGRSGRTQTPPPSDSYHAPANKRRPGLSGDAMTPTAGRLRVPTRMDSPNPAERRCPRPKITPSFRTGEKIDDRSVIQSAGNAPAYLSFVALHRSKRE